MQVDDHNCAALAAGQPQLNRGKTRRQLLQGCAVDQVIELADAKGDDYDHKLLTYLIPLHQSATEMAALIDSSSRAELQTLARKMVSDSQVEDKQLTSWLQVWYGVSLQASPIAQTAVSPTTTTRSADDVAHPTVTSGTPSGSSNTLTLWLAVGAGCSSWL